MKLKPGRNTIVVNLATKKYMPAHDGETWDGDWPSRYPLTTGEGDTVAIYLWTHDTANGIPYTYDLTRDGGIFVLWSDNDSKEKIEKAKKEIRHSQDVVSLRVFKIKRFEVGQ